MKKLFLIGLILFGQNVFAGLEIDLRCHKSSFDVYDQDYAPSGCRCTGNLNYKESHMFSVELVEPDPGLLLFKCLDDEGNQMPENVEAEGQMFQCGEIKTDAQSRRTFDPNTEPVIEGGPYCQDGVMQLCSSDSYCQDNSDLTFGPYSSAVSDIKGKCLAEKFYSKIKTCRSCMKMGTGASDGQTKVAIVYDASNWNFAPPPSELIQRTQAFLTGLISPLKEAVNEGKLTFYLVPDVFDSHNGQLKRRVANLINDEHGLRVEEGISPRWVEDARTFANEACEGIDIVVLIVNDDPATNSLGVTFYDQNAAQGTGLILIKAGSHADVLFHEFGHQFAGINDHLPPLAKLEEPGRTICTLEPWRCFEESNTSVMRWVHDHPANVVQKYYHGDCDTIGSVLGVVNSSSVCVVPRSLNFTPLPPQF